MIFSGTDIAGLLGQLATLIGVLVVGRWAYTAKKDSALTLFQVQNDHSTNLRDNIDKIEHKVDALDRGQKHIIAKVGLLENGWQENRGDIDRLIEDTEQRHRREQDQWKEPLPGGRRDRRTR